MVVATVRSSWTAFDGSGLALASSTPEKGWRVGSPGAGEAPGELA